MHNRAVVFDLDDTLYPYRAFVGSGFRAVAAVADRCYGIAASTALRTLRHARVNGHRGCELQQLCVANGLPVSALITFRLVMVDHQPTLWLPRVSRAVLQALRPSCRIGVLTNGTPSVQAAKIAALGVASLVDEVVYACEHGDGSGKPAPEAFGVVLERLGVAPHRTVFVGNDPDADMAGARAVGLHTIHVRRASLGDAVVPCHASVTSLLDVPALVAHMVAEEPVHAV